MRAGQHCCYRDIYYVVELHNSCRYYRLRVHLESRLLFRKILCLQYSLSYGLVHVSHVSYNVVEIYLKLIRRKSQSQTVTSAEVRIETFFSRLEVCLSNSLKSMWDDSSDSFLSSLIL